MKKSTLSTTLISILILYPCATFSATIHVPAEQPTIQAGIDAAADGDLVLVSPGTYVETIDFLGKAITLQSEAGADVTVIDGNSNGSVVTFDGGETEEALLDGFKLTNGYSSGNGGGIHCNESSPTITNCTITGNNSGIEGGGIYFSASSALIMTCTISRNESTTWGGGVACYESTPTIMNCVIMQNTSPYGGGGISCYESSPKVKNCRFAQNTTTHYGGAVSCFVSSSPMISNCVILKNIAPYGGGMFCGDSSYPVMNNCTVSENAADFGGAVYCTRLSHPTIMNSILWNDIALEGMELWIGTFDDPSTLTVSYSDVMGGMGGVHVELGSILYWLEGNLDAEPLFVGAEDYHVSIGSPCIDAGDPAPSSDDKCFPPSLGTERNDMGGYGGLAACGWICWDVDEDGFGDEACGGADCDDSDPQLNPGVEELCDGIDTDCDGTIPDDEANPDGDEWMICEGDCDDTDPEIYPGHPEIVGNGRDDDCDGEIDEPYSTFHVPCGHPTIQAGIDKAYKGDLVLVAPGLYRENLDFRGKAITLRSERGPILTTIDGGQRGSAVVFESIWAEGAVIDGFTIRNGFAEDGGGIYCKSSSPTIMNCVITDNFTDEYGSGGGIYCYSSSSPSIVDCSILRNNATFGGGILCWGSSQTITNCTISGNSASRDGGGIYCSESSATITDCMISSNNASYGGGIRCYKSSPAIIGCMIFNNEAERSGAGIQCTDRSKPTIENCTIWGNSAPSGGGIFCEGSYTAPTIMSCSIWGNSALSGGGIKSSVFSTPTIANCAVWGNYAVAGAGLYCWRASLEIINSTIRGNVAFSGGGLACSGCDPAEITNSILWGNLALIGHELWVGRSGYPSLLSVSYSDVQGGEAAAYVNPYSTLNWLQGNIHRIPHFVGLFDHHLQPGSPCIDAGTDAGVYTDRDGDERPQGAGFDMGADEFVPAGICFVSMLL